MNAVSLQNISKMYRIYEKPQHKLREALVRSIFRKMHTCHREFWAVKDVNLDIPKGMTVGIVGKNGSGKSTLLQIIVGVLTPTTGIVQVQGRVSALLELGSGFNPEFTGVENVYMNAAILGLSKKETDDRFDQIVEFAEIGDFINQPVKIYSSGMYLRLAFAVAVNVEPDILIVDEALSVGDHIFQRRCFRRIEEFQKKGVTIIFVSHDIGTVKSICQRAILMDKGETIDYGDTNAIVNRYYEMLEYHEKEDIPEHTTKNNINNIESINIEGIEKNTFEHRYGSGKAYIKNIQILDKHRRTVSHIEGDQECVINVSILFEEMVREPVVGIMFKTLAGIEIYGTNTQLLDIKLKTTKPGESLIVEFHQKIQFQTGIYTISVGIAEIHKGELSPLDYIWDVAFLKVINNKKFSGLVDMETRIFDRKERDI